MNPIISRFENIKSLINNSNVKIIAVTKTFSYEEISPLVEHGHLHFGENKVQEAQSKWLILKKKKTKFKSALNWEVAKQQSKRSSETL
jgi:uncharacterized pyridoxal phosphate-containing UPF0001 family protein